MKKYWPLGLLVTTLIWGSFFSTLLHAKIFFFQFWVGLGLLTYSKEGFKLSKLHLLLIGLLSFAAISSFWASDLYLVWNGHYWRGTGVYFYLSLLLAYLSLSSKEEDKLDQLLMGTIAVSGIVSACSIFDSLFIRGESASTVFTENTNATAGLVGIAFLLVFKKFDDLKKIKKFLPGSLLILFFVAIVLSGSRSALGGLILSFSLLIIFNNRNLIKGSIVAALSVLVALVAYYFLIDASFINNMFARAENFHRLKIWSGAFNAFLDAPILGWGLHGLYEGFWNNFPGTLSGQFQWIDNAHSIFFNILSELGLIGFSLFAAILFLIYKKIAVLDSKEKSFWSIFLIYVFSYLLFQPVYIDTLVFLLIAFSIFTAQTINKEEKEFEFKGILPTTTKVVLGLFLMIISFQQIHQHYLIKEARKALVNGRDYRPIWKNFLSSTPMVDKTGALLHLSNQFTLLLSDQSLTEKDKSIFNILILREFEKFSKIGQHRPRYQDAYGVWLMRNRKLDEAEIVFDNILKKSPIIVNIINLKAELKILKGDKSSALSLFEKSNELHKSVSTKMNLARLYAESGYREKAKQMLKEALILSPANPQILQILNQFN